jgi:YggT family protein
VTVLATVRTEIGDFLAALLVVYTIIIIAYIVMQLVFSLGVRIPYSRWSRAIMDFLGDISEPFLRIGLQVGPLDLSPMVAILVLQIGGGIVVNLIQG